MKVREAKVKDARQLAQLIQEVESTSQYMLWEAGEREVSAERQEKMINELEKTGNSTILVAVEKGALVGYLIAIGGNAKRNKHTAYIVAGISERYRGLGIGTKLFQTLDKWAVKNNICRLELTVVTKNEAGIALYKKNGFEIEGTKRNSLFINGEFVDEYYMSKLSL